MSSITMKNVYEFSPMANSPRIFPRSISRVPSRIPSFSISEEILSEEILSEEILSEEILSKENLSEENISEEILSEENLSEENLSEENLLEKNLSISEETLSAEILSAENLSEENLLEENLSEENLLEENLSEENLLEENLSAENLSEDTFSEEEESLRIFRLSQEENPSTSTNEKEKKGDINPLLNALREIQGKVADLKPTGCNEEIKKFDELRKTVEKLASSSENNDSVKESVSSTSKRKRKAASGRSEELDKEMKETKQRIVLMRKALNIFYDLEQKNFQHIANINKGQTDVITRVNFLERINKLAESIPLFVKLDGERPPPLCGSRGPGPKWVPKAGDLVAAMSISPENNEDYILGEFLSYNKTKKQYVINDIYEQQSIITQYVIPLPKMRADPESCPEALFPNGAKVMALFPDTTCFYPAFVDRQPFRSFDPYKLKFEGDNNEIKEVHQRYVICDVTTN